MAKRERKALTQRERQCIKVAREKALRKSVHVCWTRVRIVLGAALVGLVVSAGVWEYWAQGVSRSAEQTITGMWRLTARAGYKLQTVYLDGRSRTSVKEVDSALDIKKGSPILALPLDELRAKLEALPTVKHAAIERALPGSLYVHLVERDPVAIWQNEGKLALIDDEGTVMNDLDLDDYRELPLVIGKGAPAHVKEALELLAAQKTLAPKVTAVVRVGERRWNMLLSGGVEVKLPEKNPLEAWERVATMAEEDKLLNRAIRSVDLREPTRMYIRLAPQAVPDSAPVSARAT